MVGRVVSTKMAKTAVVLVESKKIHPLYGKTFLRTKKFLVDDAFGVSNGDIVVFEKSKPMSKRKHWTIIKVLGRDIVSLEQAELQQESAEAIAEVLPETKEETEQLESKLNTEEVKETKKKTEKKGGKRVNRATK